MVNKLKGKYEEFMSSAEEMKQKGKDKITKEIDKAKRKLASE